MTAAAEGPGRRREAGLGKVLVANRGEIACRVIRSLRRLGIGSVAVHSEAERGAAHVIDADEAVLLGPAPVAESYLRSDRILAAALEHGCDAIHPGYGFLSERADFATAVEEAGLAFVGPTPAQLRDFGEKHVARSLASAAGLPLLPGTGLLADLEEAFAAASEIGYPVMLKSSAGGGGIGMRACASAEELGEAFEQVGRLSQANFGSDAVFLERFVRRARHVEVQVFGDGAGGVIVLGDRDCSLQRRNQKVIEEAPAPALRDEVRAALAREAVDLAASVNYRSAGTVEFVVDADTGEHWFLEVNTRLQVEHGVTEQIYDIDLVEWMLRLAGGDRSMFERELPVPRGHAVEARVYAENPLRDFRPSSGRLTRVELPAGVRCDGWVSSGTEVTPFYDPLLLKVIAHGEDRRDAIAQLSRSLGELRLDGIETNVDHLAAALGTEPFATGDVTTSLLADMAFVPDGVEVLDGGGQTIVVAAPGRVGYWSVGVPPSGPIDDWSFRLANRLLGNPADAAGLECTVRGPKLVLHRATTFALGGAEMSATLDGAPVPRWKPVTAAAGSVLELREVSGGGARGYVCFRGGIDVPEVLGSRTTFTLGGFGGHAGRALLDGDLLRLGAEPRDPSAADLLPVGLRPELPHRWELAVIDGPHAAPDYLTEADVELLYGTDWEVHYNSARTGIRLIGPRFTWARSDGGEAGLHPSNVHDNAYAVGSVDFTGDMPVILGPDGPSLGGFVCPANVAEVDLWKLGQLTAGDLVRLVPVSADDARRALEVREAALASLPSSTPEPPSWTAPPRRSGPAVTVLGRTEGDSGRPALAFRRSGDRHLLVEVGPAVLDLDLRVRVHQLMTWFVDAQVDGVVDLTPGIRSLQLQLDLDRLSVERAIELVRKADEELPAVDDVVLPSRLVHLPLSWDDPAVRKAIDIYMRSVRPDAPWCPSNLEFIRRVNGLDSIDDVRRIAFDAEYVVYGLGDVYLGAPVATPLDPRHRLVTTKYNPARTWTPENAVGIGGAYLCVYGMEGPGGYQFIGRTVQVWQRWPAPGSEPWLLRFFDRLRFHPVEPDELLDRRAEVEAGRWQPDMEDGTLDLAAHHRFLDSIEDEVVEFRTRQQAAFGAERAEWEASGELAAEEAAERSLVASAPGTEVDLAPGTVAVRAPLAARVWSVGVEAGGAVGADDALVVLEAMKMETVVRAPAGGTVVQVCCEPGELVRPGHLLLVLRPEESG